MSSFRALLVEKTDAGFTRQLVERELDDLPEGDVLIDVRYSSLNYKDALSATGNPGVSRNFPHTPGIDAAGLVLESTVAEFSHGDEVLVTGYDLGMNTCGGFGQRVRVPGGWVVPLPSGLSLRDSMVIGTAGLTAALCIHKLEEAGMNTDSGAILVTGATGGVGSVAVKLLSQLGYGQSRSARISRTSGSNSHSQPRRCPSGSRASAAQRNLGGSHRHGRGRNTLQHGQGPSLRM